MVVGPRGARDGSTPRATKMRESPKSLLMDRETSLLMIVDMQERLVPAVFDHEKATAKAALLLRAATRMGVPILVSEQYPQGIGPTCQTLSTLIPADRVMSKIHFSCAAEAEIRRRIADAGRDQIVIGGTEAHVCVQQTALDLKSEGYDVFVVVDAMASRRETDKKLATVRMSAAGVTMVSAEMVVFEWMRRADTAPFREMLSLIKGT
jgi:nicotinamidase-related amidase